MKQLLPKNISAEELEEWIGQEINQPLLVDVREDSELNVAQFPFPIVHLPLSKMTDWRQDLHKFIPINSEVVVMCHAGIRSFNFGSWLLEQKCGYKVWNLQGGIDAWSMSVDPAVPRY